MNFKHLFHNFHRKVRVELWFLVILVLVGLGAFLIMNAAIENFINSIQKEQYQVTTLDEKGIYDGQPYNPKNDFPLLIQTQSSKLNGAPLASAASTTTQPIAVVIENYTPIRGQQAGLEGASIVYETLAEGGITRLLAIFDGSPVDLIGPVRSARPYFVTWASEYLAAFTHVGGSNEALGDLKANFRIFNIDEFSDFKTVWRVKQYLAPHNAYSSIEKIQKRLEDSKYNHPLTMSRFPFKDFDTESGVIKTITIDFSLTPYAVKYVYDSATHLYSRFNGGKSHHNLKPANVLVQFVDMQVLDDVGRLRLQTHGTGKAIVFRDGQAIEGTWEKDGSINSADQPINQSWTKFFDKNGKEIELNRGQTWIEVVPNGRTVNYF